MHGGTDCVALAAGLLDPTETLALCCLLGVPPRRASPSELQRMCETSPLAAEVVHQYLFRPSRASTPPLQRLEAPSEAPPAPSRKKRKMEPVPPLPRPSFGLPTRPRDDVTITCPAVCTPRAPAAVPDGQPGGSGAPVTPPALSWCPRPMPR